MYPNRTICSMLEAMRQCYETRNFNYLPGIIEEVQNAANRMEAALSDQKDLEYARKELRKLRQEIDQLENKKEGVSNTKTESD